jgi:heterodisulfide reductase subunit A
LIERVATDPLIRIYLNSQVVAVEGFIGNFKSKIASSGKEETIEHGVIVVATGASEYKPVEYQYGKDKRILTQLELEDKITDSEFKDVNTVVMIQCVGSRNNERPYCSRICCQEAVKNALKIKQISPKTNVFVLYKDIRTYGLKESYYTRAREEGVVFIRFDETQKPEVTVDSKIIVKVKEPILDRLLEIPADLVVLSVATVPNPNKELAQMLKVPLNQNNFFLEAHLKLRPVDFATEGIYLCGLAHSPKLIPESIIQSLAAVSRANNVLSKDKIELEGNISQIIDENCDGCAYCIEPCPYKALTLLEYVRDGSIKKVVEVNETACKGCGTCQATCPKKGVIVRGFGLEQLSAMASAALES